MLPCASSIATTSGSAILTASTIFAKSTRVPPYSTLKSMSLRTAVAAVGSGGVVDGAALGPADGSAGEPLGVAGAQAAATSSSMAAADAADRDRIGSATG